MFKLDAGDFFRINMPYGIRRNSRGEWMCFNREYYPLGWQKAHGENIQFDINDPQCVLPIFTSYQDLDEELLSQLSILNGGGNRKDEHGKIYEVWFYDTIPLGFHIDPLAQFRNWENYIEIIKTLSTGRRTPEET